MLWSASLMVMKVGLVALIQILLNVDKDIKLMLAPKSHKDLPQNVSLILQGVVKRLGSLCFGGSFPSTR